MSKSFNTVTRNVKQNRRWKMLFEETVYEIRGNKSLYKGKFGSKFRKMGKTQIWFCGKPCPNLLATLFSELQLYFCYFFAMIMK